MLLDCECNHDGSHIDICDDTGVCFCKDNVGGDSCDHCEIGFFSFPTCSGINAVFKNLFKNTKLRLLKFIQTVCVIQLDLLVKHVMMMVSVLAHPDSLAISVINAYLNTT